MNKIVFARIVINSFIKNIYKYAVNKEFKKWSSQFLRLKGIFQVYQQIYLESQR